MKRFLSSFYLKIIAITAMTFDHVGKMLYFFYPSNEIIANLEYAFSLIGRLAFPIFLFLIWEGFYNTKNIKKYFCRLGFMSPLMIAGFLIVGFIPQLGVAPFLIKYGNIFIDLLLSLLFFYLINQENIKLQLLSILPIGYFVFCLLLQTNVIVINNDIVKVLLSGLMSQFSFITPVLLILIAIFALIRNLYFRNKFIDDENKYKELFAIPSFQTRTYIYAFAVSTLVLIIYGLTFVPQINFNTNFVIDSYFILALIPIIFYNGTLGYNSKIFKSAYYLYYPVSLCIIFLVVYLTSIF